MMLSVTGKLAARLPFRSKALVNRATVYNSPKDSQVAGSIVRLTDRLDWEFGWSFTVTATFSILTLEVTTHVWQKRTL